MKKPIIIGIAGGTASGKSTLAETIQETFGDDVTVLVHDFYYKSYIHLTKEERMKENYDCPEAYETNLLISQIEDLKKGKVIQRPIYSYVERLREEKTVTVVPTKIILIEGILVLENKALLELMDLKIFVDTDADIRLSRLLKRDVVERGLDMDYIISKYISTLKPMHEKHIEPSKQNADIIIPKGGQNRAAVNAVIEAIKGFLDV